MRITNNIEPVGFDATDSLSTMGLKLILLKIQNLNPSYTATHGRVSATAPTMHEAIALCLNGVYQVKFIKK